MHHIDGIDQDQITMFPEALDDYTRLDKPFRFMRKSLTSPISIIKCMSG
jgi:hypothetical protein